jgi:hypothetical protein
MRSGTGRRAVAAHQVAVDVRPFGAAIGLGCLLLSAGCTSDGGPGPMLSGTGAPTLAFESIDGPPGPVFERLVRDLAAEARARQVQVVSRESSAAYRVRGYLAANVLDGWTHYEWVWDVYDAEKRRTVRVGGEERGGRAGDAWASLDDFTLSQIAHASMDRLVTFLGSPPDAAAPAAFASGGIGGTSDQMSAAAIGAPPAVSAPSAALR